MRSRVVLSVALLTLALCGGAARGQEPSPSPSEQQALDCATNLKYLGMALEMWATDHDNKYPDRLSVLVPDYLLRMPECPAAGADTYSATYRTLDPPRLYAFHCEGHHHGQAGLAEDRPCYDGEKGLTVK